MKCESDDFMPFMKMCCLKVFVSICAVFCFAGVAVAEEPAATLLWPEGAPGAKGETDADKPALFFHSAAKETANGACVLICPGGGYGALMMSYEGHDAARWFNSIGVSAAVLRSRLGPAYNHPAPMLDVQRAMRHLRAKAGEYGIDAKRIGVMGFSAGGHLAGTAAVHFDGGKQDAEDVIERVSSRPDFAVLVYPVISMMDQTTHSGSRTNLLGENPSAELLEKMSLERQVTKETPPTFLLHTGEDTVVPAENSVGFYSALRRAGVPAELHVYRAGNHGVGLDRNEATNSWPGLLADWMGYMGFLKKGE
jgi:acetyl esterase/lipase